MREERELDRELRVLEVELKKLEAEYNMYFAGRLPRPPWEQRARVDAHVKRIDRLHIPNYGDRFRFETLQGRYTALNELWERAMRAREEGRPSPFGRRPVSAAAAAAPAGTSRGEDAPNRAQTFKVALSDPAAEERKLHELYDRLVAARREVGQEPMPFQKFASVVQSQVDKLRTRGTGEVTFQVAVKDGKVAFTAKAKKDEA